MFGLKDVLQNKNLKSIIEHSWSVSWPMTLIMFFIFLIGITDVYVAGKFGKEIQAAYGLAFQLFFILTIAGHALSVGAVALVSRFFTSGEKKEFNESIDTALIITIFLGAFFSLIGILFSSNFLGFFNIPKMLKTDAVLLSVIYSMGILFNYIVLTTNGILRACKKIRNSLVTMAVICVLNIFLDFLLAFKTSLGFKGIAYATVASFFFGMLINILFVKKISALAVKFSVRSMKKIVSISWPAGLLQIFWQLGAMALFYILSLLPQHNVEIIAAFTNGLKIESAIFLPAFAFNMACAVVIGNLMGEKSHEDAFHGGIVTALIGVVFVSIMTIIVLFNARNIMSLLSDNQFVIDEGVRYVYISLIFEPFLAWGVILGGGLNGAGDTKGLMFIIASCVWLIRIPLSYFLAVYLGLGAVAVWWSMNASVLAQTFFITRRYFAREWLNLSLSSR